MAKKRRYLIYVGADKAGSTWYYEVLRAHPEVAVTEAKDLYFFDRKFSRGTEWYTAQFPGGDDGTKFWCEISHDYMYSEVALRRMADFDQDLIVLVSLRRPQDRLLSEFMHLRRTGHVSKNMSVAEATDEYREALVGRSKYSNHIRLLFQIFGRDRVQVFFFEDLTADAVNHGRRVAARLGLDPCGIDPDVASTRFNSRALTRAAVPPRLLLAASRVLRWVGRERVLGKVKRNLVVRRLLFRSVRDEVAESQIPTEVVREFAADVARLEELLDFDVRSFWGFEVS